MQDEHVKAKLRDADAIGCFYIESPAMRQLLGKLQCDDYNTLVAASSVIRPGVAKSGHDAPFITRHRAPNPESVEYLHPIFEEHLGETYGVMVYQEDVMKIAHHFGGIALDDTDILRRAMSGKTRGLSHFEVIKDSVLSRIVKSEDIAKSWLKPSGSRWKALRGTVSVRPIQPRMQ